RRARRRAPGGGILHETVVRRWYRRADPGCASGAAMAARDPPDRRLGRVCRPGVRVAGVVDGGAVLAKRLRAERRVDGAGPRLRPRLGLHPTLRAVAGPRRARVALALAGCGGAARPRLVRGPGRGDGYGGAGQGRLELQLSARAGRRARRARCTQAGGPAVPDSIRDPTVPSADDALPGWAPGHGWPGRRDGELRL